MESVTRRALAGWALAVLALAAGSFGLAYVTSSGASPAAYAPTVP